MCPTVHNHPRVKLELTATNVTNPSLLITFKSGNLGRKSCLSYSWYLYLSFPTLPTQQKAITDRPKQITTEKEHKPWIQQKIRVQLVKSREALAIECCAQWVREDQSDWEQRFRRRATLKQHHCACFCYLPKSMSFRIPLAGSIIRFCGLMSRWQMPSEWMKAKLRNNWYMYSWKQQKRRKKSNRTDVS